MAQHAKAYLLALPAAFLLAGCLIVLPPPTQRPAPPGGVSPTSQELESVEAPSAPRAAAGTANRLANGIFEGLSGWTKLHGSRVPDHTDLSAKDGTVIWERTGSRNDGGSLGLFQDLNLSVGSARSVFLSLDVRVDFHALANTGWWSEERGGSGEMPVHITVFYGDASGGKQRWDYGFLVHDKAQEVLWLNPATGKYEPKPGTTTLKNVAPVPAGKWCRFSFNLLDDDVRLDLKGNPLPRPATITRVMLYGNGWDFKGGVGRAELKVR